MKIGLVMFSLIYSLVVPFITEWCTFCCRKKEHWVTITLSINFLYKFSSLIKKVVTLGYLPFILYPSLLDAFSSVLGWYWFGFEGLFGNVFYSWGLVWCPARTRFCSWWCQGYVWYCPDRREIFSRDYWGLDFLFDVFTSFIGVVGTVGEGSKELKASNFHSVTSLAMWSARSARARKSGLCLVNPCGITIVSHRNEERDEYDVRRFHPATLRCY